MPDIRAIMPAVFNTIVGLCFAIIPCQAVAGFIINSAVLEFTAGSPRHQDIDIISQSENNDYIVTQVAEILHPGATDEGYHVITDFTQSSLLVSPDKTVLAGRSRKVLRFILLKEPDEKEHIYRVAVKPVIKSVGSSDKLGLKILVGYEVMVIIRPKVINPDYTAIRQGRVLTVANTGNASIFFQSGKQCAAADKCKNIPVARIYPGQTERITLPDDMPASYSIWDGKNSTEKQF